MKDWKLVVGRMLKVVVIFLMQLFVVPFLLHLFLQNLVP